ncbi:unnamed protein product [Calypogeia fissa]
MAGASDAVSESGGEEGDYETDSDGTSTLALRRRAASDDEEDETGHRRGPRGVDAAGGHLTQDAASSVDGEISRLPYSDEEEDDDVDDGEGAPPLYEEDEDEELLLDDDDHQTDSPSRQLLARRRRRKGSDEEEDDDDVGRRPDGDDGSVGGSKRRDSPETAEGVARPGGKEVTEEEKKEAEPFVVPTAGAFYMHDDRFRDNGGARPRRGMVGRKLWEAKDEKPWVHDLFEEFNNLGHDHFADQGYPRGGRGRGRGRSRGRGRGRGGAGRFYNDDVGGMRSRAYGRGRGSRRDAAESVREDAPNYAAKVLTEAEVAVGTDQSRAAQSIQRQENAAVKKATSGSYLNSASPPFIPSGVLQQKLAGRVDGSGETDGSSGQISSKGRDQYGVRNSFSRANIETTGVSKSAAGSGRGSVSGGQSSGLVWSQGDGVLSTTVPQQGARQASSVNQQQKQNLHSGGNPVVDSSAQQSGRGTASQAQTASFVRPPQTQEQTQQSQQGQPATSNPRSASHPSSGSAGTNSVMGSNNTRYKGNGGGRAGPVGSMPVAGRGSYVFPGAPSAGLRVGDPGFQPPPAVGPVAVQYGGQSPAGIGVPAVGMPIPNYPYGYPNPEVTWVPVLAGGGAIPASYGAPYMMEVAPSHMYYTPATAQPATAYHLPGRDLNGAKHQPPGGLWKPPPSPELGTDEFGQRQSKPRRYSEMNFGQ